MPVWKMKKCSALFLFCLLLTACQAIHPPVSDESQGEIYRPPTPALEGLNMQQAAQVINQAAIENNEFLQQPTCTNNLVYITDITIPDGTEVTPGTVLDKQWEVENQGTCNWNENYRLKLIAGTEISTPAERALIPARSGTRAIINIQLPAPAEPGNYHSAWQAYSPSGEPFGDPIFIEIVVSEGSPSS